MISKISNEYKRYIRVLNDKVYKMSWKQLFNTYYYLLSITHLVQWCCHTVDMIMIDRIKRIPLHPKIYDK